MSLKVVLVLLALAGVVGTAFGYFLRWIISLGKRGSMELEIKQMMLEAREDTKRIREDADEDAKKIVEERKKELKEREEQLKKNESRIIKKEEFLDNRQIDIDKEVESVKKKIEEIKDVRKKVEDLEQKKLSELERIAGLSAEHAKEELLKVIERQEEEDIVLRMQKLESAGRERLEQKAREILTTSIHRLGNAVPSDVMTTTVALPSDDMKGKIIGKEGRNIKALERATGVDIRPVLMPHIPASIRRPMRMARSRSEVNR